MYGVDGAKPGLTIEESQDSPPREGKLRRHLDTDRPKGTGSSHPPACYAAALRASFLTFMQLLKKRE